MTPTRTRLPRGADPDLRALAFDLNPAPILVVDGEGRLIVLNEAAENLFGRGVGVMTRGRLADALPEGAVLARMIQRVQAEGVGLQERGVEIVLADLKPVEADVLVAPLPDGMVAATLHVRIAESGLERARGTLRSVAGMGRTLAHEVKNPLAGIRGAAQLLRSGDGAGPEDAALAQLIVDECDRIRRLIDRVEAFADDRPTERRAVNIHRVLDRVRALMAAGGGEDVQFRERFDPSLPHALGDEDELIQIFLNLVKNACEAVRARGDGRGEVALVTSFRLGARSAPLEIQIQDNGPGIGPDLRERLFDPFVTTKASGAGLGLTLVAKLIAANGGAIDFESEPGRTVFLVRLPLAPKDRRADR